MAPDESPRSAKKCPKSEFRLYSTTQMQDNAAGRSYAREEVDVADEKIALRADHRVLESLPTPHETDDRDIAVSEMPK